jgi:hypothetical protein
VLDQRDSALFYLKVYSFNFFINAFAVIILIYGGCFEVAVWIVWEKFGVLGGRLGVWIDRGKIVSKKGLNDTIQKKKSQSFGLR